MLQKLKHRLKNQRGMTLIELLAVVVILGIISAIAVPSVGGIIQKTKVDAVKADGIQVLNAAKTYVAQNGIPTSDLTPSKLGSYVDESSIPTYTVSVTEDSNNKITYQLSATVTGVGKQTVKFTNAEISDINNNTATKVDVTTP